MLEMLLHILTAYMLTHLYLLFGQCTLVYNPDKKTKFIVNEDVGEHNKHAKYTCTCSLFLF